MILPVWADEKSRQPVFSGADFAKVLCYQGFGRNRLDPVERPSRREFEPNEVRGEQKHTKVL